jgi:protein TonB
VAAGQKISGPNPTYPPGARQNRIQGTVVLQGIIDKQGNVSLLEIVDSPALDLSAAAIQAVRDWKYRPYTLQGEPIDVETTIQVNYTLR